MKEEGKEKARREARREEEKEIVKMIKDLSAEVVSTQTSQTINRSKLIPIHVKNVGLCPTGLLTVSGIPFSMTQLAEYVNQRENIFTILQIYADFRNQDAKPPLSDKAQ